MATFLSGLTSTLGLPSNRAGRAVTPDSSSLDAGRTLGEVTSSALMTTISALPSLGNAAWTRS